ncbi:MAG: shikimate dehydrogenase [bacterium]
MTPQRDVIKLPTASMKPDEEAASLAKSMRIGSRTKTVGIFGYPIAHSLSPVIHNAAFAKLGLDFVYLPFPVRPDHLEDAVKAIKSLNLVGVNITIPHKRKVLDYLDEVDHQARMMASVNTILHQDGRLIGYNTDGEGFLESLREEGGFDPQGKRVFVIGAGGAGSAISFALVKAGIRSIILANRTPGKAKILLERLEENAKAKCEFSLVDFNQRNSPGIMDKVDLFINATSVGMHPNDSLLINPDLFPPHIFIYDVIYHRKTKLLKEAEKRNLASLSGVGMLIYQGALSFKIWTNQTPPINEMRRVLMGEFNKQKDTG